MKKNSPKKYLYEIKFRRGRSNPEFELFYGNVSDLSARSPDHSGINSLCVISHHMDIKTVKLLCTQNMKKSQEDVSLTEVTRETLADSDSSHGMLADLVNDYFLPHGDYPNIR
jgi:hypothetical protein